jgi:hypothetical protein
LSHQQIQARRRANPSLGVRFNGDFPVSITNREAHETLKRALEQYVEAMTPMPYWRYRCTGDFVLKHGIPFEPRRMPREYSRWSRRAGKCYPSSLSLAIEEGLLYVEGFAMDNLGIRDRRHAWCAEKTSNFVVDPTWRPVGLAYYGVIFDPEFVRRYFEAFGYSILDNDSADPVILRGLIPEKVWRDGAKFDARSLLDSLPGPFFEKERK